MRKHVLVYLSFAIIILIFYFMNQSFVRSMIYPAPRIGVGAPPEHFNEITLELRDGTATGWHFEESYNEAASIIYFHGNGENLETIRHSGLLDELLKLNISFLVIDYPGYGRSKGKASEEGVHAAGSLSIQWMRKHHPNQKLILFGWSLGAAIALQAASNHPDEVGGIVAASGWSSLKDVAAIHYPGWLVSALLDESYDSIRAANNIRCPALILHGANDEIIPAEHGRMITRAVGPPAKFVEIAAGHNDLLSHPRLWKEVSTFLNEF